MPIHDWSRAEAGIFHDFHHALIEQIKRVLNDGVLPSEFFALAEQFAAGLGSDVLTLHVPQDPGNGGTNQASARSPGSHSGGVVLARPKTRPIAETEMEFYRHKQNVVAVRRVSGDRVAVVSPGNESTRHALDSSVRKAADFLDRGVHLLILDLLPPDPLDPLGIHGAIWDYLDGRPYSPAPGKPLTMATYESARATHAYVVPVAEGDALPDMPLFLEPGGCVENPLESSYQSAREAVPRRWQAVLESPHPGD